MDSNTQLKSFLNAYLALVALTICSLFLAESGLFEASLPRPMIEVIILAIVGVKVFLVAYNFMELRFSPKWLLGLMGGWTTAIITVLSAFIMFYSYVIQS